MNRFVAVALLIVPVCAGANTTCRQDHVHYPSSVVSTLQGAEYILTDGCPQNTLTVEAQSPRLAIRFSEQEGQPASSSQITGGDAGRQSMSSTIQPNSTTNNVALSPQTPTQVSIVQFDLNQAGMRPGEINKVDTWPLNTPVTVTGFTCDLGYEQHNLALSFRRAHTVAKLLVRRGVQVKLVEGKGECCPISDNKSLNRRVEISPFQEAANDHP